MAVSEILRLIGGGLLALICSYVGLLVKRRYKSREIFYTRAVAFCKTLNSEITLSKCAIPDIVSHFANDKGEFDSTLKECIVLSKSGKEVMLDDIKCNILKSDEKRELSVFFNGLGKSTLQDQLSSIEGYRRAFEDRRSICAKEAKSLGSMYFKLAVLMGLALILILA